MNSFDKGVSRHLLFNMKIDFPFLKGYEKATLFIIGNGFDLCHSVSSKYKDFYYWLIANGEEEFVNDMETAFPQLDEDENTLWSNFEEALGLPDIDKVYQYYYKSPNYSLDGKEWEIEANEVVEKVSDLCSMVRPLMKVWVKNIRTDHIHQMFEISKGSWFLTFNYTKLLEEVYDIPSRHICHIHGYIDDDEELITGRDKIRSELVIGAKSDEEENAKKKIITLFNNLVKDKIAQIEKNETFFLSIPEIKHVIVFGHSLADIDLLYFEKVLSLIGHDAIWHFSQRSRKDRIRIDAFKKKCKLSVRCDIKEGETILL